MDCKLDSLLKDVYVQLTEPPLASNPYPRLLHLIRAQSARMELWHSVPQDACKVLLNELVRTP